MNKIIWQLRLNELGNEILLQKLAWNLWWNVWKTLKTKNVERWIDCNGFINVLECIFFIHNKQKWNVSDRRSKRHHFYVMALIYVIIISFIFSSQNFIAVKNALFRLKVNHQNWNNFNGLIFTKIVFFIIICQGIYRIVIKSILYWLKISR